MYTYPIYKETRKWVVHQSIFRQIFRHFRLVSFREILCRSVISSGNSRSYGPIKFELFFKFLNDHNAWKVRRFIEVNRASRSLMNLKNNSNLIGPCDRLLQEDLTLLHKISRTFHETSQSNMAIIHAKGTVHVRPFNVTSHLTSRKSANKLLSM